MRQHTRFVVSSVGDANQLLHTDLRLQTWFNEFIDADEFAAREAVRNNTPRYVHEVTTRAVRAHTPVTELRSTDL
jgi:hypothetical protein